MVTDHNNLRWLLDAKWSSGKLARWALRLGEYDFSISHTKGALNAAADALSRYPLHGRPRALTALSPVPPPPKPASCIMFGSNVPVCTPS